MYVYVDTTLARPNTVITTNSVQVKSGLSELLVDQALFIHSSRCVVTGDESESCMLLD